MRHFYASTSNTMSFFLLSLLTLVIQSPGLPMEAKLLNNLRYSFYSIFTATNYNCC